MRVLLLLLLFLTACTETENKIQSKAYYDLAGLFNAHISRLASGRPQVEKTVLIKDKQEKIVTGKIDRRKELDLFLQADLNKQSYQSAYTIHQTQNEISYKLKTGEKMPVKHLLIRFDTKGLPQQIEAEIYARNYLYESEKKLKAHFENNQLKTYHIEGYQELFIGSRKYFSVDAKIKGDY
ncbi:hypothetical protein [Emticicia fluvialis]|uniref:hypothetical protein n=1 Tax=Emticicia fluvialis TaxID=2974474 RepID=UPI0021650329|nr:hypothetical protein [Emticicia fluvialis]